MRPEEILPTAEQKARVEARSYRMFLIEHEDVGEPYVSLYQQPAFASPERV